MEPVTTALPSGAKAAPSTSPRCPRSAAIDVPVRASQIAPVSSSLAVTSDAPSGLKARLAIVPSWPRTSTASPVRRFQTRVTPATSPPATCRPSAENAIDWTGSSCVRWKTTDPVRTSQTTACEPRAAASREPSPLNATPVTGNGSPGTRSSPRGAPVSAAQRRTTPSRSPVATTSPVGSNTAARGLCAVSSVATGSSPSGEIRQTVTPRSPAPSARLPSPLRSTLRAGTTGPPDVVRRRPVRRFQTPTRPLSSAAATSRPCPSSATPRTGSRASITERRREPRSARRSWSRASSVAAVVAARAARTTLCSGSRSSAASDCAASWRESARRA